MVRCRGNYPAWLEHSGFILFFSKLGFVMLITGDQGSLDTERSQESWSPYLEKKNPFCSIGHLYPFKAARDLQLWLLSEGLPVASMMKTAPLVCRLPVHTQICYRLSLFTSLIKAPCSLLLPDVIKVSTLCLSDAS